MTERVEIPAYTFNWLKGDRYGEVLNVAKVTRPNWYVSKEETIEIAQVKLDISGETIRVVYADCTPVKPTSIPKEDNSD